MHKIVDPGTPEQLPAFHEVFLSSSGELPWSRQSARSDTKDDKCNIVDVYDNNNFDILW